MINEHVDMVLQSVSRDVAAGQPTSIYPLASAFTMDTISRICYGESLGCLESPDLGRSLTEALDALLHETNTILSIHYPILHYFPRSGGISLTAKFIKVMSAALDKSESSEKANLATSLIQEVVRPGGYDIAKHHIPANTTISSSNYFRCLDEKYFPEPFSFNPDRWLSLDTTAMSASWLPFSKGSRSCIGQHMSMVETKLFITHFVHRFRLKQLVDGYHTYARLVLQAKTSLEVYLKEALVMRPP
ncbi:cytochrome P450 [Cadophora sp. MPI-SDFR-AT-0126]|nr:cytochrome P450 [Leotiomycetes sp. MPI-SDFR-AT-0126]